MYSNNIKNLTLLHMIILIKEQHIIKKRVSAKIAKKVTCAPRFPCVFGKRIW